MPDSGGTIDLTSGAESTLAPVMLTGGESSARYVALGDHWAEVDEDTRNAVTPRIYVNRLSGQVLRIQERREWLPDLDRATLTRRLCNGERRPVVVDESLAGVRPGPLAIVSGFAGATTIGKRSRDGYYATEVQLQRCGHPTVVVGRCPSSMRCSQPVLTNDVIAWTEGKGSTTNDGFARLFVRSLRTGRLRIARRLLDPGCTLLALGNRIYLTSGVRLLEALL